MTSYPEAAALSASPLQTRNGQTGSIQIQTRTQLCHAARQERILHLPQERPDGRQRPQHLQAAELQEEAAGQVRTVGRLRVLGEERQERPVRTVPGRDAEGAQERNGEGDQGAQQLPDQLGDVLAGERGFGG